MNKSEYGYFDEEANEYVITRPDTPTPWMNMLGETENFAGVISNTAGGYTYHLDPANKRLTRYRYIGLPDDRPGRYVYLKDRDADEYWSSTWQPVIKWSGYDYECRHGLGYTKIAFNYAGIASENTYFVPLGKNFEIWHVKVKNTTGRQRLMSLFSYNEWCMWNMVKDQFNAQAISFQGRGHYDEELNTFYFSSYSDSSVVLEDRSFKRQYAFFASSEKVDSIDFRRDKFIGPYRDEGNPIAIENGKCSGFYAPGGYHAACTHYDFELAPGEEKVFCFAMGSYAQPGEEKNDVAACFALGGFDRELGRVKDYWNDYISKFNCRTPDDGMNIISNVWHQYSLRQDFDKSVNYYYTGWSGKQFGFRDRAQKSIALLTIDPSSARHCIDMLCRMQMPTGEAYHGYSKLTGVAGRGCSDDPMWFVQMAHAYLRETGDFAILEKEYPFVDDSVATLYQHLKLCCDWIWSRRGPHGLPMIGTADWCDAMNLQSKGETEMVACQFVLACKLMAEIADLSGREKDIESFREMGDEMKQAINETCWDGDWYLRAYDIDGNPIGSHRNKEGQIFLNAQSWAVISGVADAERTRKCQDAVHERLSLKYGLKIHGPGFQTYDIKVGPIGVTPAGSKENAGIFNHAHSWGIIAACVAGNGDRALQYYQAGLPYNQDPDVMMTEPYTFAQSYLSDEHPEYGRSRVSWHTGTIPWTFIAVTQYILGIRAEFDGLRVDPCISGKWREFEVKRVFREVEYNIAVRNPDGVCRGVKSIELDGQILKSNLIPYNNERKCQTAIVIMG